MAKAKPAFGGSKAKPFGAKGKAGGTKAVKGVKAASKASGKSKKPF